jgi:hypothetical protein
LEEEEAAGLLVVALGVTGVLEEEEAAGLLVVALGVMGVLEEEGEAAGLVFEGFCRALVVGRVVLLARERLCCALW